MGTFVQSGGTDTVAYLYIGYAAGGSGAYNLSGSGLLSTPNEYVGFTGSGTSRKRAAPISLPD